MLGTGAGGSPGQNLAALGEITAKLCGILIVDMLDLIHAESCIPCGACRPLTLSLSMVIPPYLKVRYAGNQNGRSLSLESSMEKSLEVWAGAL